MTQTAATTQPAADAGTQAKEEKPEFAFDWTKVQDKEGIYAELHRCLIAGSRATKDGRVVAPQSLGRDVFLGALEGIFHLVETKGRIALPGGYGSIFLQGVSARDQRTPQGKIVSVPPRWALRINPGTKFEERMKVLPPPPVEETAKGQQEAKAKAAAAASAKSE